MAKNIQCGNITGSTGVVIGGGRVVVNGRTYGDKDKNGNVGVEIDQDDDE